MFKFLKIHLFIILFLVLNACIFAAPGQNQNADDNHPFLRLSTQEQQENQELQEEKSRESNVTEDFPQKTELQEGSEQEQQYKQQETLREESKSPLPFQDFKERWNAITEEYLSNLYINKLNKVSEENRTFYTASITNTIELRVYVSEDTVYQLEIISQIKSGSEVHKMLEAWNQMIKVLHPNIEIHDVDAFFHEIGVGPNANLTNVKEKKVSLFGVDYEIIPTNQRYIFRGSYFNKQ